METQPANSPVLWDTRDRAGLPGQPGIPSLAVKVLLTLRDPSGSLQGCWKAG